VVEQAIAGRLSAGVSRALRRPQAVLVLMILAYVVVFGRLTWMQQSNYGTFGFDMGIFDQGIWLLSRFQNPFVTVRGLSLWANHVNPNVLLLVPIYWLGGGPHALYLVQTIALALGAWPVWLLARDKLEEPWSALVVAGAYLLFPSLQWTNWWHFHPEALAVTPMLFAWWFAKNRRWWRYALCVALVVACKEDAALVIVALGLLVAFRFNREVGLFTASIALFWLVIAVEFVIPGGGRPLAQDPIFSDRFGTLGNTLPSIMYNAIRHPSRVLVLALQPNRLDYYRMMFVPVAGLCFLSPAMLIALPALVVNVTSIYGSAYSIRFHYQALIIAAIFIAVTETCGRFAGNPPVRRAAMGLLAATSLAANVAWSPSPIGVKYRSGIWALHKADKVAFDRAVELVPPKAGVSASYTIISHLTHRKHAYEWPNPFRAGNWGIRDLNTHPPTNVDYLVLDTGINAETQPLFDGLVASGGGFVVVYRGGPVVVAKRVSPG
jgi:uncharacterized membrane protein